MRLLGFEITRAPSTKTAVGPLQWPTSVSSPGGWFPVIREAATGFWQRNIEIRQESVLAYASVYACTTLIATDIAKLRIKLVEQDRYGIWNEVARNSPFWAVLRKPNHYQTRIKFIEQWMLSKLIHGNAYVLKQRDERRIVTSMYVLDPTRCRPMVAPTGDVYYSIGQDNLSQVSESQVVVPATEIVHDIMTPLYHPLCGVSPISACGLAAVQGLRVQQHSANFFGNGAQPGGILTAPGTISEETAKNLQSNWEHNFGGHNAGRVAVLGDGLKYERMAMSAVDSQLIDQLRWTADNVCQAFRVPTYMVSVGPPPPYNNIEALQVQYYAQTLQAHLESIELLLDEGLGLTTAQSDRPLGTEFELDDLLRMDTSTRVKAASDAVGSGAMAPNEARLRYLDLPPVPGGDSPLQQEQYWPLAHLSSRPLPERPITPPAEIAAGPKKHAIDRRYRTSDLSLDGARD